MKRSAPYTSVATPQDDDKDENESDDYDDHRLARNLLDIRESSTSGWDHFPYTSEMTGASITAIYEPKFMEIFSAYCQNLNISSVLDVSKHLMVSCLDHLIAFTCWARESPSRVSWIRRVLDENPDLRPEVRNGLSMILIYCLSAARTRSLVLSGAGTSVYSVGDVSGPSPSVSAQLAPLSSVTSPYANALTLHQRFIPSHPLPLPQSSSLLSPPELTLSGSLLTDPASSMAMHGGVGVGVGGMNSVGMNGSGLPPLMNHLSPSLSVPPTLPVIDMFTTLQDTEAGLGIVNKTSLKIYNDPYNYFNFLKICISGLIDAGKLPENERLNQPKKSKKMVENRDEMLSFGQLHSFLSKLLSKGDNVAARNHVQNIINVWQSKTKGMKSSRFAFALRAIGPALHVPFTTSTASSSASASASASPGPAVPMTALIPTPSSLASSSSSSSSSSSTMPVASFPPGVSPIMTSSLAPISVSVSVSRFDSPSVTNLSEDKMGSGMSEGGSGSGSCRDSLVPAGVVGSSGFSSSAAFSAMSAVNMSDGLSLHHQHSQQQSLPPPPTAAVSSSGGATVDPSPLVATSSSTSSTSSSSLSNSLPFCLHRPVVAVKCERLFQSPATRLSASHTTPSSTSSSSSSGWNLTENRIFYVNEFLKSRPNLVHFVDECQLAQSADWRAGRLTRTSFFDSASLCSELQLRKALLCTWKPAEFAQLCGFLNRWNDHVLQTTTGNSNSNSNSSSSSSASDGSRVPLTLIEFWKLYNAEHMTKSLFSPHNSSSSPGLPAAAAGGGGVGSGVLMWEDTMEVGVVVRECESLQVHEDCWAMLHLDELTMLLKSHTLDTLRVKGMARERHSWSEDSASDSSRLSKTGLEGGAGSAGSSSSSSSSSSSGSVVSSSHSSTSIVTRNSHFGSSSSIFRVDSSKSISAGPTDVSVPTTTKTRKGRKSSFGEVLCSIFPQIRFSRFLCAPKKRLDLDLGGQRGGAEAVAEKMMMDGRDDDGARRRSSSGKSSNDSREKKKKKKEEEEEVCHSGRSSVGEKRMGDINSGDRCGEGNRDDGDGDGDGQEVEDVVVKMLVHQNSQLVQAHTAPSPHCTTSHSPLSGGPSDAVPCYQHSSIVLNAPPPYLSNGVLHQTVGLISDPADKVFSKVELISGQFYDIVLKPVKTS